MAITSEEHEILLAELRESFGRVAYSHKTHEKEADRKKATDDRVRLWQLILSAGTTAGLLGVLVTETQVLEILSTFAAAAMSFLAAYAKNFRAGEIASEHQASAQRLWLIREQYVSLLGDVEARAVSLPDARERRDALQKRLAEVYEAAPRTSSDAYAAAQQALKVDEELTFSDAEIDMFLPARLRKAPSNLPLNVPGSLTDGTQPVPLRLGQVEGEEAPTPANHPLDQRSPARTDEPTDQ